MRILMVWWTLISAAALAGELKVATLHPLLTDLAGRIGGEKVQVVDLTGPNHDPHKFEPGARDLERAKGAGLYLLSGKGLEPYLPKLRDLAGAERIVEVGETLPTLRTESLCDHGHHSHLEVRDDPHWWHSLDCWRRAARVVAKAFAKADPENAGFYAERARICRAELAELDRWVRGQLASVPHERRTLATAHQAFAYFCHEYGWRMLPVQGLNREQVASPKFVSEVAKTIREEKVAAVFPEQQSNPKMLETLSKSTGVRLGKPLIAAGSGTIEAMFRNNVNSIVEALGNPPPGGGE